MSKDERYDVSQHEGYTEGLWVTRKQGGVNTIQLWGQYSVLGVAECDAMRERQNPREEQNEANAQLMAASPQILDALKKAYVREEELKQLINDLLDPDLEEGFVLERLKEVVDWGY